jgi:hypothetical protein
VNYEEKEIQTGIPEEAFELQCPDMQFKAGVLQQFILLDGKYVEKLNELEQFSSEILRQLFKIIFFNLFLVLSLRFVMFFLPSIAFIN